MQIIWSKSAEKDLDSILEYFKDKGEEDVGLKIITQLLNSTSRLEKFPHSGRQSVLPQRRELVIPDLPYFLLYRISTQVRIIRVIHTSKLWRG
ncbi:type II toxin-antitoxin system RelE/ParE family toxin [Marinifilum sp. JC120]|nr:type II toxin-antitoxin system RelE/ParE family toxin [Marinifilum sp. JC120]